MTAKPVTPARLRARVRKYEGLLDLPPLVIHPAILDRAYGMTFTASSGFIVILIDDRELRCDELLDRIILHELAHAECHKRYGSLRHDYRWKAVCRRLSRKTGLLVN